MGGPYKVWQGRRWYQKPGTATAAVPGESNHGLGLAVDIANVDKALTWLLANAMRFGWSWELASEPWHIHYWVGDTIPAAVLAYEEEQMYNEADMAAFPWRYAGRGMPGVPAGKTTLWVHGSTYANTVAIRAELAAQRAVIEHLAAAIAAGGGTVDTVGILAGVDTRLAALRAQVLADMRDAVADAAEGGAAALRAHA